MWKQENTSVKTELLCVKWSRPLSHLISMVILYSFPIFQCRNYNSGRRWSNVLKVIVISGKTTMERHVSLAHKGPCCTHYTTARRFPEIVETSTHNWKRLHSDHACQKTYNYFSPKKCMPHTIIWKVSLVVKHDKKDTPQKHASQMEILDTGRLRHR